MKRIILSGLVLLSYFYPNIYNQETPVEKGLKAISADVIKAQTGFLASDWTEGREAGERGEYLAGEVIISPACYSFTESAREEISQEPEGSFQHLL
ncbi:MAG: hypothetical protein NTW82_08915 [Bacteroidia bacterium]|nr:hypothetical protein [Bacteroidia bacterium]